MERFDDLHRSAVGGVEDVGTSRMAESLPRSLAAFLARLAYLTPEGQALVLDTVGPGSRLVLEALRLVECGGPGLTDLGRRLSERFADDVSLEVYPGDGVAQLGPRIRRIARVVSTQELGVAAAATGEPETAERDNYLFEYNLVPEQEESSSEAGAVVGVARMGQRLRVWQISGRGADTVVVLESMEQLPKNGEQPLVLTNSEDEPPSRLLRRTLGLSDEKNG